MKWKDSDDAEGMAPEKPFEEAYSPLNGKAAGMAFNRTLRPGGLFFMIFGAAALVLMVIVWFSTAGRTTGVGERLSAIEKRLGDLETGRLQREQGGGPSDAGQRLEKQIADLVERLDRIESTNAKRLAEIDNAVKALAREKNTASAAIKSADKKNGGPSPVIHIVQKSETLYGISQQYGLSLNQLREMNQMKKGATIYPGQKLIVGP